MSGIYRKFGLVLLLAVVSGCGSTGFMPGDSHTVEATRSGEVPGAALAEFERALQAAEQQQWQHALEMFGDLWLAYPALSGPALNAALVCRQQGDSEAAGQWFERALQSNPDNAVAHTEYAVQLRQEGEFERAQQHYLAALESDEHYARAHYNLAILYDLYMNNKADALRHFKRYQVLSGTENRQVNGWIADLERQQRRTGGGS
jgi:tetratricopeptide (TPR) repeat protein